MNTNFLFEEKDIVFAENLYKDIADDYLREKSIANVAAIKVAQKFFEEKSYEANIETGLYNVPELVEEYSFSDIYVNNNCIYVISAKENGELQIPKFNIENDIKPALYMFIEEKNDEASADIKGFIFPENINSAVTGDVQNYYLIDRQNLVDFEEIRYILDNQAEDVNIDDINLYKFTDGLVYEVGDFINRLLMSKKSREILLKIYNAKQIFKNISFISENTESGTKVSGDFEQLLESETEELNTSVYAENTTFEYSTSTTPSLDVLDLEEAADIDYDAQESESTNNDLLEESFEEQDFSSEENPQIDEIDEKQGPTYSSNEIDSLFDEDKEPIKEEEDTDFNEANVSEGATQNNKKMLASLSIAAILVIAISGYFAYTKLNGQTQELPVQMPSVQDAEVAGQDVEKTEAMPNETVENTQSNLTNEGNALSIPAIEKNLDASILVSNLKIDWEVPPGYISNTKAKRYLVKLGKVIQLNLKTELLLLSKPPITNKIVVELKYNEKMKKFDVSRITVSSGEKTVDDVIISTVTKVLDSGINVNMDAFGKISGNPLLVIRL